MNRFLGVYNKYSEWDCGKRDAADNVLPCVGLCLGTAVLETDFVTPTSDRYALIVRSPFIMISEMISFYGLNLDLTLTV